MEDIRALSKIETNVVGYYCVFENSTLFSLVLRNQPIYANFICTLALLREIKGLILIALGFIARKNL